jgi:hypothetical protein
MSATRSLLPLVAGVLVTLVACSSASTSSTTSSRPGTSAATTTAGTLPPTTTVPPTTTTEPLVTEGGIVMVANCSDVNGAARLLTDELAANGFQTRKATNGAGIDNSLEATKIYVIPGSEAVARSLSRLLGGVELFQMPTPVWIKDGTAGLGDANVLVMLGHDRAGKRLADMAS